MSTNGEHGQRALIIDKKLTTGCQAPTVVEFCTGEFPDCMNYELRTAGLVVSSPFTDDGSRSGIAVW